MNESDERQVVSLLESVPDMTIATLREDGFPQATTVSHVNDGLTIYFGTSSASQKAANIARDARVSLTVHTPYRLWREIVGLSVGGLAHAVAEGAEYREVGRLLLEKFPQVHEYASTESEEVALFRVEPLVITLLDYRKGFGHATTFDLRRP